MKCVLTVLGRDRTGIIATISQALYENKVNILDLNQTILDAYFTMVMIISLPDDLPFDALLEKLTACGEHLGLEVRMQRTDIFDAMHRI